MFARSVNGCGVVDTTVFVLDYPRFFTPNGDGFHDEWNITGLRNQQDAKIYIFDRLGKLLTTLRPSSDFGWNGIYNGNQMPSSEYWFLVEYREPNKNIMKQFKGHFSLIR
ncbi:T9SS type B sorting domain-containing protein [Aquimarina sp. 2201CG1-2-11]|uniref:T9SS type B sorting domain-containing protein n=1 Tax=Aquimarina discodermiae TaxID=3231043 RepID=UPI003461C502